MSLNLDNNDRILLAKLIHSESAGESYLDKRRVCSVVVNRIKHKSFPNTVSGVIYQRNQFSGVDGHNFYYNPSHNSCKDSMKAVDDVLENGTIINALFFCNPKISSRGGLKFMSKLQLVVRGRNHWYYTLNDKK